MLTVKSCSYSGGMSDKDPVTYSWMSVVTRDGKFDPFAAAPIAIAVILIGVAFLRLRGQRVFPLFVVLSEFLCAVLAVAIMIYWPGIAFLFDTVRHTPVYFAAIVLLAFAVLESAFRAAAVWRDVRSLERPDSAGIGIPRHMLRAVNIIAVLPLACIPFMGRGPSALSVGDIIAIAFYLLLLWVPYLFLGLTANLALTRRERWAYVWTAVSSILAVVFLAFLIMKG